MTGSNADPGAMPSARLELRSKVVMAGGELRYVIANDGNLPLLFGAGYGYEEPTTEGWRPLPLRLAFSAWGSQIAPGASTNEIPARVPQNLRSGRYRLTTSVSVLQMNGAPQRGPEGPITIALSSGFTVDDSDAGDHPA